MEESHCDAEETKPRVPVLSATSFIHDFQPNCIFPNALTGSSMYAANERAAMRPGALSAHTDPGWGAIRGFAKLVVISTLLESARSFCSPYRMDVTG
ncbi:uncharacterized protein N7459_002545 [Penicillium hispanicum]|uniref:uncharacterized protein n=1 Tax=Penicillium hispanicum TaxID=1080232 RepID=UPI002540118F|nr:uncharacterized protein N7459_002545 [Penicillium hispanicum]KAJ5586780.1 hypothetical protein N7459_002545 [Penicillium hispanicum]